MKIKWQTSDTNLKSPEPTGSDEKNLEVDNIQVGHNFAEMYIRFGENVVIMPPASIKKLTQDLEKLVEDFESQHGKIKAPPKKKQESSAHKVVKALYKTRKISSKLVSINTKRRKHLPLKDD